MKLIRKRKPSIKTMLGVTKVKRRISKATGIPTTKSGRKRKVKNLLTNVPMVNTNDPEQQLIDRITQLSIPPLAWVAWCEYYPHVLY